ncbi:hypothetical protein V2J09_011745 [Rumex salicifolius]
MISNSFHGIVLCFILFTATSTTSSSAVCNSTCGPHRLPYPFGFSAACPIPLLCTPQTTIQLGDGADGFPVNAVTADSILISLKPSCSRPIDSLRRLFSPNFAPTRRNAFLLRNCSRPFSTCTIPTTLVRTRFELAGSDCGGARNNLSCYSERKPRGEFVDTEEVRRSGCGSLFSSIWSDADSSAGAEANETALEVGEAVVALEIEVVELRWWLLGQCGGGHGCSKGASCQKVTSPMNGEGFRCRCRNGLHGDGYIDGLGCRKGIAGGASLALLLTLASLCLCFNRKIRNSNLRKFNKHHLSESKTTAICIPIYTYKEIQKATNNFSEEHRLGTGAYGTVYRADLHGYDVAIKRIKQRETGDCIEQVINEIKLLSSVNHPNLVHLLGCAIENVEEQILVYEYMPNGTLCEHLQGERGDGLSWSDRLSIAIETAQAIAYLHSGLNPPIYHRDIKSSNILLDYGFRAKVADFGLSRFGLVESSYVSTAPQGTPGYLDPQYHQSFHLSDKSDVYSFGVVLAEIITGSKVVDFTRASNEVNLAALVVDRIGNGRVEEIIDPFLKRDEVTDPRIKCLVNEVAELAFRCLAYHQDMRPSMVEVAFELEQIGTRRDEPIDESDSSALLKSFSGIGFGLSVEEVRVGSLGFYMVQKEASCESSVLDMEDASDHVSTQESWSSQHSSPFIK